MVRRTIGATPIGERVTSITIEKALDEDGDEYLRVALRLDKLANLKVEELAHMVQTIERAVAEIDERFASVRLAEAA